MKCWERSDFGQEFSSAGSRRAFATVLRRATPLLILILICAGCGRKSERRRVWGNVDFEGQPIEKGLIVFTPIEDTRGSSTGASIVDGHYEVPAAKGPYVNGVYRVEISSLRKTDKLIPNPFEPGTMMYFEDNFIPATYNRESTLRAVIADDPVHNQFAFSLKNSGGS
jgi:hypothetical protein